MEQYAIDLENVSRIYKRDEFEVRALDDISLRIESGRFVAIMGPSGSGKTTLLNLITGIDHASSGHVRVGGEEITAMKERELARWRARHIGLVFQFYNLIPVLTAFENVELPLLLTDLKKAERREHVETALRVVGLADRMSHYPRQLSGGQEQRVAIARAIVTDPTIVVADEDAVTDDGTELLGLLHQRHIDDVIVMGVHANVCVLGRPYGIRQFVYWEKKPLLCRDLTDSFHRDPRGHSWGTERIVAHIERYWCPTITSDQLVGGEPFGFHNARLPPHVTL